MVERRCVRIPPLKRQMAAACPHAGQAGMSVPSHPGQRASSTRNYWGAGVPDARMQAHTTAMSGMSAGHDTPESSVTLSKTPPVPFLASQVTERRGRHRVPTWSPTLARGDASHGYDPHCDSGSRRRSCCPLDGKGHGRAVPGRPTDDSLTVLWLPRFRRSLLASPGRPAIDVAAKAPTVASFASARSRRQAPHRLT